MVSIEDEVNKHRNIKDRGQLEKLVKDYKNLALQYASNLTMAGQYSAVAHRLQEICDRLPAPNLIRYPAGSTRGSPVKTAALTSDEQARIDAEWKKKTKS